MAEALFYIGYAADHDVRFKASSGGVGTAIMHYLLSQPEYGTGLTFVFDSESCKYVPKLIHSADDINICGSIYHDIDIIGFIRKHIPEIKGEMVVSCPPCQVTGVRQLLNKNGIDCFILSFCCSGQTTIEGTWKYYELLGIDKEEVADMQYRGNGWPSGIQIKLKDGTKIFRGNYTEPWVTMHRSRLYRPQRCLYCKWDTGRNADIALADPWIKEYMESDKIGNTMFVVFSDKGRGVFEALTKERIINSVPTDYNSYAIAQKPNIQKSLFIDGQKTYLYWLVRLTENTCYRKWATKSQKNMKKHIFIARCLKRFITLMNLNQRNLK